MLQPRCLIYIALGMAHVLLMLPNGILCQQFGSANGGDGLHLVEPTPALQSKEGDLTTVVWVKNGNNEQFGRFHSLRPELGLLTSTARTFIQEGVTTEYATQVLGTTLDNGRVYAQYLKKSSRVLYENELPQPSVVTSWVGESTSALLQSHNDLLHADEPNWQEIDDNLKYAFVGNTDFVGRLKETHISPAASTVTLASSKLSQNYASLINAPINLVRNHVADARKVAAQKVLPIGDLPTYTVKQNFSPSGFSWTDDDENLLRNPQSDFESKDRSPKLYYPQLMAGSLQGDENKKPFVADLLPKRKLATTTYYGFADFTTIVGDSVIVFTPSSSSQALNLGQVTSIKGEATIGEVLPPQISKVPISVTEDLIMPTQVQQLAMKTDFMTKESSLNDNKEKTEDQVFEDVKRTQTTSISAAEVFVESTEVSPVDIPISVVHIASTSMSKASEINVPVLPSLSRPSDEEVSAIFALLKNKDSSKTVELSQEHTSTAIIESTVPMSSSSVLPVSTLNGATTVFIEEDPFANFVESSETSQIGQTESSTKKPELITNNPQEIVDISSTGQSSSAIESIVEISDSSKVNKDIDVTTDCIPTSQVFLTQLPQTLTYLSTHVFNDEKAQSQSVETIVSNTFEIKETTKHYCIQASTMDLTAIPVTVKVEDTSLPSSSELPNSTDSDSTESVLITSNTDEPSTTLSDENDVEEETTTIVSTTEEPASEESNDENDDESGEEIELIYKTLYTTYTYLTTIFQDSSSSILSRTEVVTNVMTSTLGVPESTDSVDLSNIPSIEPTATEALAQNQLTALKGLESIIRAGEDSADEQESNTFEVAKATESLDDILVTKTFHTTYTYFTTIFAEGETEIISRTEVLTNVITTTPSLPMSSFILNMTSALELEEETLGTVPTTISSHSLNYSTMVRAGVTAPDILDLNEYSSVTLVTDVRSSSSNGEGHIINNALPDTHSRNSPEQIFALDDQISSESNTEEILPSATLLLQTSFTTFTYYTTMYSGDTTNVVSRLETITNVVTETLQPSKTSDQLEDASNNLPITYFTTFTYWTKLAKDGTISTLSREETISNVITPTVNSIDIASTVATYPSLSLVANNISSEADAERLTTKTLEPTTYYTTYTYYTTSYESDLTITDSRFETVTNIITPTVTLSSDSNLQPTLSVNLLDGSKGQESVVSSPKASSVILYDYKKIIDADGISTLYFTTQVTPTTDGNGVFVEATSSTSSLFIDEIKKLLSPTPILQSTVDPDGSTVSVRQYKTGLVRLIEGTRIGNNTTTLYKSRVIGTLIDNRYAQIIESTSSFLFEQPSAVQDASAVRIQPTKTVDNIYDSIAQTLTPTTASVLETSISDSEDHVTTEHPSKQGEDDADADDNEDSLLNNKKKFTPVIRPFASRNRPQFAPKRKNGGIPSSATIITRSDFTPTITATPALKTSGLGGRFSSSRRGSSQLLSSSSSRRFSRPSRTSNSVGQQQTSSLPSISGGRNRFASSSSRRPITPQRSSLGSFRPGLSSAFAGSSRFRIKPTGTGFALNTQSSSKASITTQTPSSAEDNDDDEEESSTQAYEEEAVTTENSRRSQNPLLRFRRPLPVSSPRAGNSAPNNLVSTRRNPLAARSKTSATTTTTTTTTARPKPRSFQRPATGLAGLTARQRPQSNLFPPRGLFQAKNIESSSEQPNEKKVKAEAEDDAEYDDEDGDNEDDDGENDGEDNAQRRRRSNAKKNSGKSNNVDNKGKVRQLTRRSKREADVNLPSRSNFRNRFRQRSKTANVEDPQPNDATENFDSAPPTRAGRISSRFGNKHATTAGTSQATSGSHHRSIRPTRPSSGRAQFTLREKDIAATTKSLPRHGTNSFRRPKTTAPTRRTQTSLSNSRRLKAYANSNIGSETSLRSGSSTNSRSRGNNLNNARSRPSTGRGRNRNEFNTEVLTNAFDGTITVTHVLPAEVTIPVVNGQVTEYKNVITAKTSTEILGPQQYTSFVGANGQTSLALTREESMTNLAGATEITQFVLHETLTTTITFTPTTIRGRKTSFSHVLPSTVYSVENVVSTMQPQLANAPLANILLSQLLLGNIALPGGQGAVPGNPLLGALTQPIVQTQVPATPVTEFRTHTSTYVTTIFEGMSTIIPVTFKGRKILTTVYDTTAQTITATEFITDTIVTTPTQQPMQQVGQVNSLLLQQLLLQQQFQPQPSQDQLPLKHLLQTEANLHELDTNNLQDSKDEDDSIPAVEETNQSSKTSRKKSRKSGKSGKNGHRRNKQTQNQAEASVVTLYVSGRRPGFLESSILGTKYSRTKLNLSEASLPGSVTENLDEARYNLATRVMSNGVEVIIAGDKTKLQENGNELEKKISSPQTKRPMTLAPSTLKNQMILLMPSNKQDNLTIHVNSNHFVTKTCLTTYTYRTTYLQDGKTTIESREKVISNIATEEKNNYPKINPTPSMGVTLSRTPQLAVGIFPTTYSYYYTLYDGESPLVVTSKNIILNTITAPDDYIMFLQPSEAAMPVLDTNTYFSRVYISKTVYDSDVQKIVTKPETLTQIVVTESYPARSTSILTSYYALDIDETRTRLAESTSQHDLDMHIYATKTFLTTLTYLKAATSSGSQASNNLATSANYHTKVIENVVTESISSSLLEPDLLTKFRNELKRGKNQRRVIVTTATLLGGQTLKITAMKLLASNEEASSATTTLSSSKSQLVTTSSAKVLSIAHSQTQEKAESTKPPEDTSMAGSEHAAVYIAAPPAPTTLKIEKLNHNKNKTKLRVPSENTNPLPTMNNLFNTISLNSLTALRPVLNAVAGLIQSKFTGSDGPTFKNSTSALSSESPMYIPVKNSQSSYNSNSFEHHQDPNLELAPPQSLHIEPPRADFTIAEDNWLEAESKIVNAIQERHKLQPNVKQAISLVNGGIPIRPGEVITANSDVIVGKPNGIEHPKIYTLQSQQQHAHMQQQSQQQQQSHYQNNAIPLRYGNGKQSAFPTSVSYFQHVIQHPFKHKSQQLPQKDTIYKTSEENFDNILKPPPFTSQRPNLSTFKYQNTHEVGGSANVVGATSFSHWFQKKPWAFDNGAAKLTPNIFNLNNELKDNEIIEIKRVPQIFSTDLPPTTAFFQDSKDAMTSQNTFQFMGPNGYNLSFNDHIKYPTHIDKSVEKFPLAPSQVKNSNAKKNPTWADLPLKNYISEQNIAPYKATEQRQENKKPLSNASHQQINVKNYMLSHNVAINAPPLTFKKEMEYPVATSVHGVPSNAGHIAIPHVKISPNQKQVQVNLTPLSNVPSLLVIPQNAVKSDTQTQTLGSFAVPNDAQKAHNTNRYEQAISNSKIMFDNGPKSRPHANVHRNVNVQHIPLGTYNYGDKFSPPTASPSPISMSFGNSWTLLVDKDNDKNIDPSVNDFIDQTAAPSASKGNLQVSHKFLNVMSQQNKTEYDKNLKIDKSKMPLLTPFSALQVNYMDETFNEAEAKPSFSSSVQNQITSLTRNNVNKPTGVVSTARPNKKITTALPKVINGPKSIQNASIKPKFPFSSGSPFTPIGNKKISPAKTSVVSDANKKVFIATGEVFRVPSSQNVSVHGTQNKRIKANVVEHEVLESQETSHVASKEQGASNSEGLKALISTEKSKSSPPAVDLTRNSEIVTNHFFNVKKSEVLGMSPPPFEPTHKYTKSTFHSTNSHFPNSPRIPSRNMIPPPSTLLPMNSVIEKTYSLQKNSRRNHVVSTISDVPSKHNSKDQYHQKASSTMKHKQLSSSVVSSHPSSTPFAISTSIHFSKSFKQSLEESIRGTNTFYDPIHLEGLKESRKVHTSVISSKMLSTTMPVLLSQTKDKQHFNTFIEENTPGNIYLEPSIESMAYTPSTENIRAPTTIIETPYLSKSRNSLTMDKINTPNKTQAANQRTRIILPTKYVTNTETITKTTILTSTAYSMQSAHVNIKDHKTLRTTTFLVTKTLTSTILDTITEVHTLLQPTRVTEAHTFISTETTTETATATETETETETKLHSTTVFTTTFFEQNQRTNSPTVNYGSVLDYNINEKEINHLEKPANNKFNLSSSNIDEVKTHTNKHVENVNGDNNNIFIVLTNKQSGNTNSADGSKNNFADSNGSPVGEIELDYDENISFDIPTRDEQLFEDSESKGKVNNVLLGGVLIAAPERDPTQPSLSNGTADYPICRPSCKSSKNEVCKYLQSKAHCVCRPGFARMFPDRPCKPTYTYTMKIHANRIGNYHLGFDHQLADKTSTEFQHLAAITHDAIDRMVMQSDFRDIYHGVHLLSFEKGIVTDKHDEGVFANLLLQLSDISDEKRLEGVLKKFLRLSNFSIGGTELLTSKAGSEALAINDFNECSSSAFNDCSKNARCFNLDGTYTCSCIEGYVDQSENPVYPGRVCSTEIVGCAQCHYHGQCIATDNLTPASGLKPTVCECFPWYSGSSCQLNLKVLLIALIGVGTFLFIVLLICLLLTCTKNRSEPLRPRATAFLGIQPMNPQSASLISIKVSPKRSRKFTSRLLKAGKTNDKHAMIKDTSSESSQSSVPYVLKESGHSLRKDKSSNHKHDVRFPKSIENSILQNDVSASRSHGKALLLPTFAPYQHAVLTEIEQSDRSLTVMIPRAKYHPSVLPQTKLLHHQLTMERMEKTERDQDIAHSPNTEGHHKKNAGALVSAGYEVSAVVSKNVLNIESEDPASAEVNSSSNFSNLHAITIEDSEKTTSRENASESHQSDSHLYKADENFIDTMDEWLDNMQHKQLSAEARSFDETTVRAATKLIKRNCDNHTTITNEEANTMAERDIGSTFLLPHTHLYKPERESEISGLESF